MTGDAPLHEPSRIASHVAAWRSRLVTEVGLLCMPTIVGVGVFTVLGLTLQRRSTTIDLGPLNAVAWVVVLGSFFAAAYGPILIPVAATITLARRPRWSPSTQLAWTIILLAIGATVLGYMWALDAVELP